MSTAIICRDRTQEFFVLRTASRRQQAWMSGTGGAEPRTPPPEDDGSVPIQNQPPWFRVVTSFTELERTYREKVAALSAAQREILGRRFAGGGGAGASRFGGAGPSSSSGPGAEEHDELMQEYQDAVEQHSADIKRLFQEAEHMVKVGVRVKGSEETACTDELAAAENVRRHLTQRLSAMVNDFRSTQHGFAMQLKKRDERMKVLAGDSAAAEAVRERVEREDRVHQLQEQGVTEADITEMLLLEARAKETNSSVLKLLDSVTELQQMFTDLRDLVVEQGSMIDRIETQVDRSLISVQKGIVEMKKARESQKSCAIM